MIKHRKDNKWRPRKGVTSSLDIGKNRMRGRCVFYMCTSGKWHIAAKCEASEKMGVDWTKFDLADCKQASQSPQVGVACNSVWLLCVSALCRIYTECCVFCVLIILAVFDNVKVQDAKHGKIFLKLLKASLVRTSLSGLLVRTCHCPRLINCK